MVDIAIVRRANDHELMVSLTEEDCSKLFPGTKLVEGDEIIIGYEGNAAQGISLFPAAEQKRGITRAMKCVAQERAQKKKGTGMLAWTRVWLPRQQLGTMNEFRPPTKIPLEISDGKLLIPALPSTWHGPNIKEVLAKGNGQIAPQLKWHTPQPAEPPREEEPPPPPAETPDVIIEEPSAEPPPPPLPAPPPPPQIVIIGIEEHVEGLLPPEVSWASSDERRDTFRKLAEHIALANRLLEPLDAEVKLTVEDNRIVVHRVYRLGMRRRPTPKEPAR